MSTAVIGRVSATRIAPSAPRTRIRQQAEVDGATPSSHLRITRRGYVLLTMLIAFPLVIAAFMFTVNGGGAAANGDATSTSFEHVTVQSGDTLWQVAERIAPSADPRDVVSDIVHLNQLSTSDLQAGQSLAIPTQYMSAQK